MPPPLPSPLKGWLHQRCTQLLWDGGQPPSLELSSGQLAIRQLQSGKKGLQSRDKGEGSRIKWSLAASGGISHCDRCESKFSITVIIPVPVFRQRKCKMYTDLYLKSTLPTRNNFFTLGEENLHFLKSQLWWLALCLNHSAKAEVGQRGFLVGVTLDF